MPRAALTVAVGLILLLLSSLGEGNSTSSHIGLLFELFREVGFAAVVAVVIWLIFEHFSSADRERAWKARIEDITQNVFYAVLQRKLPPAAIEAANALLLNHNFVRGKTEVIYVLSQEEFTNGSEEFLYISAHGTLSYSVINITGVARTYPILIDVGGHPDPELRKLAVVTAASVRQSNKTRSIDIDESARKDDGGQIRYEIAYVSVSPGEEIHVSISFKTPKDYFDTELFRVYAPTSELSLTIVDETKSLIVGANSVHPQQLELLMDSGATGTYRFAMLHYLLPHQGIQFWWSRAREG